MALWLAIGAVAGAVIGTKLLHVLPHRTLGLLFAGILLVSAIRLFISTDADGRGTPAGATVAALVVVGLATGILAGLLGVGGGIVMVPAMILLFGIPPVIAKGTSAAVIIPTAVMGTWRNRKKGNADLRAAAIIGGAGDHHRRARRDPRRQDERRPLERAVRHLLAASPSACCGSCAASADQGPASTAAVPLADVPLTAGSPEARRRAGLSLRRGTTAPVTAELRHVDGRPVIWVELGGETASGFRGVPLSSTTR